MTAIGSFQIEREIMRAAERKISCALAAGSPGHATSNILDEYANLPTEDERVAFVSALAARLAVKQIILSASI